MDKDKEQSEKSDLSIPLSRLRRFEKEMNSRLTIHFSMDDDVLESIENLIKDEVTRIVEEKKQKESTSEKCLQPSDIQSSTQYTSQLDGFEGVKCSRNYCNMDINIETSTTRKLHPYLYPS